MKYQKNTHELSPKDLDDLFDPQAIMSYEIDDLFDNIRQHDSQPMTDAVPNYRLMPVSPAFGRTLEEDDYLPGIPREVDISPELLSEETDYEYVQPQIVRSTPPPLPKPGLRTSHLEDMFTQGTYDTSVDVRHVVPFQMEGPTYGALIHGQKDTLILGSEALSGSDSSLSTRLYDAISGDGFRRDVKYEIVKDRTHARQLMGRRLAHAQPLGAQMRVFLQVGLYEAHREHYK